MIFLRVLYTVFLILYTFVDCRVVEFLCVESDCSTPLSSGSFLEHVHLSGQQFRKNSHLQISGKSITSGTSFLRVSVDGLHYFFVDSGFVHEETIRNSRQLIRVPIEFDHIASKLLTPVSESGVNTKKQDKGAHQSVTESIESDLQSSSLASVNSHADLAVQQTGATPDQTNRISDSGSVHWEFESPANNVVSDSDVDNLKNAKFNAHLPHNSATESDVKNSNSSEHTNILPGLPPDEFQPTTNSTSTPIKTALVESVDETTATLTVNNLSNFKVPDPQEVTFNSESDTVETLNSNLFGTSESTEGDIAHTSSDQNHTIVKNSTRDSHPESPSHETSSLPHSPPIIDEAHVSDTPHRNVTDGNVGDDSVFGNYSEPTSSTLPLVHNETRADDVDQFLDSEFSQKNLDMTNDGNLSSAASSDDHHAVQSPVVDHNTVNETSEYFNNSAQVAVQYADEELNTAINADHDYHNNFDYSSELVSQSSVDSSAASSSSTFPPNISPSVSESVPDQCDADCRNQNDFSSTVSSLSSSFEDHNSKYFPESDKLTTSTVSPLDHLSHDDDEKDLTYFVHNWLSKCAVSVLNQTTPIDDLPHKFACRLISFSLWYLTSMSSKLFHLIPEHTRLPLNSLLDKHFSCSLHFLLGWLIIVVHFLLASLSFLCLSPFIGSYFSRPLLQFNRQLKEHNVQLSGCLVDQENVNSIVADRLVRLTLQLQQARKELDSQQAEASTKVCNLQSEVRELRSKLLDAQARLSDKEISYNEVINDLERKLAAAEANSLDLEKKALEVEQSWETKNRELIAKHEKAMEHSKADRDELYSQAVNYYKRMESLQEEIDRLHELCKETEQKLASTEAELSSLQTVFTTLKSFDQAIAELNVPESVQSSDDVGATEYTVVPERNLDESHSEAYEEDEIPKSTNNVIKLKAYLSRFLDVGHLQAELNSLKSEVQSKEANAASERELREQLETKLQSYETEIDEVKAQCQTLNEEKSSLQTKLDVLSGYFKERELELQKDLGKHLIEGSESSEALNVARKRNRELEAELKTLRDQLTASRRDLAETERIGRRQLSELDKRSHEYWLAARAADHQLRELKDENAHLRQRLMGGTGTSSISSLHPVTPRIFDSSVPRRHLLTPARSSGPDQISLSRQSLNSSSRNSSSNFPPPNVFRLPSGVPFLPEFVPLGFPPRFPGLPPPPFAPNTSRNTMSGNHSTRSSTNGR